MVTLTLDAGQLVALLFVGVMILIIGALGEWLADNWRHRR